MSDPIRPATEIDVLRRAIEAVRALHVKVENPRHGCCAPPTLCQGHRPECRAREHPLGGVPWPCPTIRAIDAALTTSPGKDKS
jgi:hypothetical protein